MVDLPERLKLIGDATRWRTIEFLAHPILSSCSRDDGACGCNLETFLGVTQPAISRHMKLLVDGGLVTAERRGRWVYYEFDVSAFQELSPALANVAGVAKRSHDEKVSV